MPKCIKCGQREAEVPDRDRMSMRKRVCLKCYGGFLKNDLDKILNSPPKKYKEEKTGQSITAKAQLRHTYDVSIL